ncbi:MAG: response regulator transcription factor [Actinomycetes bacterium]
MSSANEPNPVVLFVEDDPGISDPMTRILQREEFEVITARTVKEARDILDRMVPDFVILDLGLADDQQGGFVVMSEIRRQGATPVMVYSANGSDDSINLALELGADDFQVKGEIGGREFINRMRAILRRSAPTRRSGGSAVEPIEIGALHVDPSAHTATLAGEPLLFSKKEFSLLMRLLEDQGKVVTREDLMADVWDENWFGSTKTLDVHIGWLRKKLGDDPADPTFIHTVRGVGFRFASPEEVEEA